MAYTKLYYHIVFGTKKRQDIITPELQPRLYSYVSGIIKNIHGIPVETGGTANHIHILTTMKPIISISDFMRLLKTNSSKWVNELPDYKNLFRWQSKYGAFSISESQVERVRNYIRNQEEHHKTVRWEEEFETLLKEHGVSYDPRFLWD